MSYHHQVSSIPLNQHHHVSSSHFKVSSRITCSIASYYTTLLGACIILLDSISAWKPPLNRIQVLGLSGNSISCIGAGAVARAIASEGGSRITRLFLNENSLLGNQGASAICRAAVRHEHLLRLGLSHCGLDGAEVAKALSALLEENTILERVCVCGNSFAESEERAMRENPRLNFKFCGSE